MKKMILFTIFTSFFLLNTTLFAKTIFEGKSYDDKITVKINKAFIFGLSLSINDRKISVSETDKIYSSDVDNTQEAVDFLIDGRYPAIKSALMRIFSGQDWNFAAVMENIISLEKEGLCPIGEPSFGGLYFKYMGPDTISDVACLKTK